MRHQHCARILCLRAEHRRELTSHNELLSEKSCRRSLPEKYRSMSDLLSTTTDDKFCLCDWRWKTADEGMGGSAPARHPGYWRKA